VEALPAFRDMAVIHDEPVYIFRKVQLLCMDLYKRFSSTNAEFNFFDIGECSIFSDNVIPTILYHLDIIPLWVSDDATAGQRAVIEGLKEDLATGRETSLERSFCFRAVAVDVCEIIVRTAREFERGREWVREMTAVQIDAYLWQIAKEDGMKDVIRFCDPNTVFF
jgi:hypothetical protein